ncbi:MAG: PP2C family protein-serine/threonine phosphatase [Aristaeellaceae bacterium]
MQDATGFDGIITEGAAPEGEKDTHADDLMVNAAVISHMGCVRQNNEDNFYFDGDLMQDQAVNDGAMIQAQLRRQYHVFAVCDGMGGLTGGERASSIGVHALDRLNLHMQGPVLTRAIENYARQTSAAVCKDSITLGEEGREGTTLALLYLSGGKACAANVGDSRVYVQRMGKLFQVSTDHSPVFKMMKRGEINREQMRKHPRGNVIELYLGMPPAKLPTPFASQFTFDLCNKDRFLICSDGLSDLLTHAELQQLLNEKADPLEAARCLVMRALEMGGKDNTTCIVADVTSEALPAATSLSLACLPQERE